MRKIAVYTAGLAIAGAFLTAPALSQAAVSTNSTALSDEHDSLSGIELFQNSKDKAFYISYSKPVTESGELVVTDQAGKIIYNQELKPGSSHVAKSYKVGNLPGGIYTIEVKTANKTYWKKIKISR
ncbi:MAG: T9SS type A sorting domain-containing protein [Hymenobacteraceae bacterium]|nr:T9SS type A sorting domain-containing protein [Hymenobacteraceae bacterium]MDX5396979.1 T9SS type A sorting domain-containing protein [Hymenobacteraceae bacterium]MDX5513053.1 T9SS type A sorting domain-containing protein [Hymenobacteraceae bacterium]